MTRISVFIRIPSDDAFELKAQALNNDSRLRAAGIAALKFAGDKKYLVNGDFSPKLPPQGAIETPSAINMANSINSGNLHVFVRIPNDDSYGLKAQALNGDPRLKAAGIAALKFVGDKKYIVDGNFSPELPPQDIVETPTIDSNDNGELHVFVRIPNDDSYELKAQALNNDPRLKRAGIKALRMVGEKQYIVEGEFSAEPSPQRTEGTASPASTREAANAVGLHVFVRMPNDDSYELKAKALNDDPRLKKAGIASLRRVGDNRYIVGGKFGPKSPSGESPGSVAPVSFPASIPRIPALPDSPVSFPASIPRIPALPLSPRPAPAPVPAPVTTKNKRKLSGCLVWGMGGIIITVFVANTFLQGILSPTQVVVIPPIVTTIATAISEIASPIPSPSQSNSGVVTGTPVETAIPTPDSGGPTTVLPPDDVPVYPSLSLNSSITGAVYSDYYQTGYPGETVELYGQNCSGTPLLYTVTDSNGSYGFFNIPARDYCVRVVTDRTIVPGGSTPELQVSIAESQNAVIDFPLSDPYQVSPTDPYAITSTPTNPNQITTPPTSPYQITATP